MQSRDREQRQIIGQRWRLHWRRCYLMTQEEGRAGATWQPFGSRQLSQWATMWCDSVLLLLLLPLPLPLRQRWKMPVENCANCVCVCVCGFLVCLLLLLPVRVTGSSSAGGVESREREEKVGHRPSSRPTDANRWRMKVKKWWKWWRRVRRRRRMRKRKREWLRKKSYFKSTNQQWHSDPTDLLAFFLFVALLMLMLHQHQQQ